MNLPSRFWAKVARSDTGCWIWTAALDAKGYGRILIDRSNRLAHRVSYEAARGAVPAGMELDHLCRDRRCVRPSHLEAVSHLVNVLRGQRNGNVGKTHCVRGHPFDSANTLMNSRGGRGCRECRRTYYSRTSQREAS